MRVAFRVDASPKIGSGHFMRCLTLAKGLKEKGAGVRFISRELPEHFRTMLVSGGCEFAPLNAIEDALGTAEVLGVSSWDWIVVDHYNLDARWESAMRSRGKRILAIDDIADRAHDCDILLDQNYYVNAQTRYLGKTPANCRLLLGPRFALLGKDYVRLRRSARTRCAPVQRILVFLGGADASNFTERAISALVPHAGKLAKVDVVIGLQHPKVAEIRSLCAKHRFDCHVQTTRMAELVQAADLAIGAGGSNTWERCSLGLPSLVVVVADNQNQAARDLALLNATRMIGTDAEVTATDLSREIGAAIQSPWIEEASKKGMELVDAQGTARLVDLMENA